MFGFLRNAPPKLLASNPGISVAGRVAFSNPRKTWTEHYNLIELLVSVLKAHGHAIQAEESWSVVAHTIEKES